MGNPSKTLAASVTGVSNSNLLAVNINNSHDAATSVATINCLDHSLDIGDEIEISLGYTGDTNKVFEGYIKITDYDIPNKIYTLTAHDKMVRAVDFFIVSSNPEEPYTFKNKSGEDLVQWILEMSGLVDFNMDATSFTFAVQNEGELNLVGCYDYANSIARTLAWNLWMNNEGVVQFANRKPFPMDGSLSQPGDPPFGNNDAQNNEPLYPNKLTDDDILSIALNRHERDLRNKIVVYGDGDLSASASQGTSWRPLAEYYDQILPVGFYKSAVLASPIITDQSFAQLACNYNLALLNRIQVEVFITIEGNSLLNCRNCVTLDQTQLPPVTNTLWYIYQIEHNWSNRGYTTSMTLRV